MKKKLFGKRPRKEEISQSKTSTGAKPGPENVNLNLSSEEILFTQDFGSWFGKSIFESTLAEIIQKEHCGHSAFGVIDVLELVAADYARGVTEMDTSHLDSQPTHFGFYSHIYSIRCEFDDAGWTGFRQELLSRVAIGCTRLRNEKVPELPAVSVPRPRPSGKSVAPTNDSGGASFSFSSSWSSTSSQRHQPAVGNLATKTGAFQAQQVLQPVANLAAAPETAPNCIKCGQATSWKVTKASNRNGNASRPYYKCVPCDKFHCFADLRGNDPTNPLCYCGISSKRQLSGLNKRPQRQLHYVCRLRICNYYEVEKTLSGDPKCLDEDVADRMRGLNLL